MTEYFVFIKGISRSQAKYKAECLTYNEYTGDDAVVKEYRTKMRCLFSEFEAKLHLVIPFLYEVLKQLETKAKEIIRKNDELLAENRGQGKSDGLLKVPRLLSACFPPKISLRPTTSR
jgi:hypothetical protein